MIFELGSSPPLDQGIAAPASSERWLQLANAPKSLHEVRSPDIARCQPKSRDAVGPYQLRRDQEQALPQALQGGPPQMGWNTEPFEPVQQVVGQQHNLEESFVGLEVLRRNLPQRIGVFQLADNQLRPSPLVVETPQMQRRQAQVGHQE